MLGCQGQKVGGASVANRASQTDRPTEALFKRLGYSKVIVLGKRIVGRPFTRSVRRINNGYY